jgi:uncharacterized protein YcbX
MQARSPASIATPSRGSRPSAWRRAELVAGQCFPCDRLYAVEDGPSGFDPAAPAHISKMKFTVLAKIPAVAKARTAYDEATGVFTARAEGRPDFAGDLRGGRRAARLRGLAGRPAGRRGPGPLRVVEGPGDYRFMDSRSGYVSIVNLASVRDLEASAGRPVDPLRFRANLYVEGWPAWVENDWTGRALTVGEARRRCSSPSSAAPPPTSIRSPPSATSSW